MAKVKYRKMNAVYQVDEGSPLEKQLKLNGFQLIQPQPAQIVQPQQATPQAKSTANNKSTATTTTTKKGK